MPTAEDRARRAADLRERAALVREHGWADYENVWSGGEVLGVRAVLNEPGALDAAVAAWAPTLWGVTGAEADAVRGYRRTRRWFAALHGERIQISAATMAELRPQMQELHAAGWRMVRMDKPIAEGCGVDVVAWFERDPLEMTEAEQASLAASNAAISDLAHALLAGDREGGDAAFAAVEQADSQVDRDSLLDKFHMPRDAHGYEDGLRAIMLRIPPGWGRWVSCSRGWYSIVIQLDRDLAEIDPDYVVHQVKEKYAGLRYYFHASEGVTEADQQRMDALVDEAEAQCERTCEMCGEPGVRHATPHGWLRTLCAECAAASEHHYQPLGELVNDLTAEHRGLWKVTCYGDFPDSHWDMSHGEVTVAGGERHRGVQVLAPPSVLRSWRIRLSDGTEIESGLVASIERVR